MNLRASLIVLIIGSWVAVGAAVVVNMDFGEESSVEQPPFFYNVPVEDIVSISLENEGESVSFHYRESIRRWYFDESAEYQETPADLFRFGGITTLLGGPRTSRVLAQTFDNPAEFGLDEPTGRYSIGLRNGEERVLLVGDTTVDGENTYAQVEGFPQLVLVDQSWSGVLNRLVQDPPVPEWLFVLNPDEVREVLLFEDNEVVRAYGINRETDSYHLCDIPVEADPCTGSQAVDEDAFRSALEHIADRQIDGAVALGLPDQTAFEPYGADEDSPYMAIRIESPSPTQPNVTEVNRVSMTIGAVTPDGNHRYAVANETSDVILVDRDWADQVLELFHGEPLIGS